MAHYVDLVPLGPGGANGHGEALACWLGPTAPVAIALGCGCGWIGPVLDWPADRVAHCFGDTDDEVLDDLERALFTLHADQMIDVAALEIIGAEVGEPALV